VESRTSREAQVLVDAVPAAYDLHRRARDGERVFEGLCFMMVMAQQPGELPIGLRTRRDPQLCQAGSSTELGTFYLALSRRIHANCASASAASSNEDISVMITP
jgi:hypothetical protein